MAWQHVSRSSFHLWSLFIIIIIVLAFQPSSPPHGSRQKRSRLSRLLFTHKPSVGVGENGRTNLPPYSTHTVCTVFHPSALEIGTRPNGGLFASCSLLPRRPFFPHSGGNWLFFIKQTHCRRQILRHYSPLPPSLPRPKLASLSPSPSLA